MFQYPDIFNTCPGRIANETAAALLLWTALIQNQHFAWSQPKFRDFFYNYCKILIGILIGPKCYAYFALVGVVALTPLFPSPICFVCYSKIRVLVLSTKIGIIVSLSFALKLSCFSCIYGGKFSVLYLPFSFSSTQVNLLNNLLNITSIWYISISSLYQIFSKAISHPFRSQLSLCTSISFITTILRILCISYLRVFFSCIYQIPLFSWEGFGGFPFSFIIWCIYFWVFCCLNFKDNNEFK